jgi:acetylglutamate kinase
MRARRCSVAVGSGVGMAHVSDEELAADVAAIALTNSKSVIVHGAGVKDYIDNQGLFGTVDLASVPVQ